MNANTPAEKNSEKFRITKICVKMFLWTVLSIFVMAVIQTALMVFTQNYFLARLLGMFSGVVIVSVIFKKYSDREKVRSSDKDYVRNSEMVNSQNRWEIPLLVSYFAAILLMSACMYFLNVYVSQKITLEYTFSPASDAVYSALGDFTVEYKENSEPRTAVISCEYIEAPPEFTVYHFGLSGGEQGVEKHQYSVRCRSGEYLAEVPGVELIVTQIESKHLGESIIFHAVPGQWGTEVFSDAVVEALFGTLDYTVLEWNE